MSFSFRDHLERLRRAGHQPAAETPTPPLPAAELHELDEVIPDELVDALLDGDFDHDHAAEIRGMIEQDEQAAARLESTERVLRALHEADRHLDIPDFSAAILARVSAERGLFSRLGLRKVLFYRYSAAAAALLLVAGVYIAQRVSPETMRLAPTQAPIAGVVEAVPSETADVFSGVRTVIHSLQQAVPSTGNAGAIQAQWVAAKRARSGLVPDMNPPISALLWVDDTESDRQWITIVPASARDSSSFASQTLYSSDSVSLRSLLAQPVRRQTQDPDAVLVRFER